MQRFGAVLLQVSRKVLALGVTLGLGAGWLPAMPPDQLSAQTMENLNTALNGERNANAKYLAFAQQADQEGFGAVASLFRAAAAAEEIHGNSHEQVIRKVGGIPSVKTEAPVVKSTAENLQAAIAAETYEFQTMYPEFTKQARKDRYVPAVATFQQPWAVEEEHAELFTEALQNLDTLKNSGRHAYYVCTTCGFTVTDLNFERCPNCLKPRDRFKLIV